MQRVTVLNITKAVTVGTEIDLADGSFTRLLGLLGKKGLAAGCGLLIRPSSGVHTFGMVFAIDVVALDRSMQVVGLWRGLVPFRITRVSLKTKSVLELRAGQIEELSIEIGDQLHVVPNGTNGTPPSGA